MAPIPALAFLTYFLAFAYGTVVGSFLNVCIFRLPRDESVVFPASHCPYCRTRLRPRDLVPLFSQIALGGRCRYCGQPISWRYLGVELLTGLCFMLVLWRTGPTLALLPNLLFAAALIAVFFIDLDTYLIPDELPLTIAVVGVTLDLVKLVLGRSHPVVVPLGWAGASLSVPIPSSFAGMVVAACALLLVGKLGTWLFKKESMGGGDVKLSGAVGAYLGLDAGILTYFLSAVVLGAVAGIVLMLLRRKRGRDYIPFGPMLAIGAIIALLFGDVVNPLLVGLYMGPYRFPR